MEYVCDAPKNRTWFRLISEGEALAESDAMHHAVEKHYRRERERADDSYKPTTTVYIEQDIGKAAYIQRTMPIFLTLRDEDGLALVTAMLPPTGRPEGTYIVVGRGNLDPYPDHGVAVESLGRHFGVTLDRQRCFPYRR
jgi:hypothetical protein